MTITVLVNNVVEREYRGSLMTPISPELNKAIESFRIAVRDGESTVAQIQARSKIRSAKEHLLSIVQREIEAAKERAEEEVWPLFRAAMDREGRR